MSASIGPAYLEAWAPGFPSSKGCIDVYIIVHFYRVVPVFAPARQPLLRGAGDQYLSIGPKRGKLGAVTLDALRPRRHDCVAVVRPITTSSIHESVSTTRRERYSSTIRKC